MQVMFLNNRRLSSICLAIIVLALSQSSCEKTIDEGQFLYLEIGSTKSQVVEQLLRSGETTNVLPVVPRLGEESLGNLSSGLVEGESLGYVLQGPDFFMSIRIEDDIVSEVYSSARSGLRGLNVASGDSRADVVQELSKFVRENPEFGVSQLVDSSKWVSLEDLSEENRGRLQNHDVWTYHENTKYSGVTLFFQDGKLAKIEYVSSPIELP